jgi:hypothetical protein
MKLVEIPIVHVRTHTVNLPYSEEVDVDTIIGRSTVWLNPDYIVSIQEEPRSLGWTMIEGLRAKHSFSEDDVATDDVATYLDGSWKKFCDEWLKENPEIDSDAEWEKREDGWHKAVDAWEQTFCDKHGFQYFHVFKKAWKNWEKLHGAVGNRELCPPRCVIYVQVGSGCQEYQTLESIPDLMARINPGSHEAHVAAFAAGGNR